jgi:MFS family permease
VAERGFSFNDWSRLQSIYYITTLAAEIPTGLLADAVGRRLVLRCAALSQAVAFLWLTVADDFLEFAGTQILLGLGQAMLSGTTSAILYDSLKAARREREYLHLESVNILFRLCGSSCAFLLGGLIAERGLTGAAWASMGFSIVAFGLACALEEPPRGGARQPTTRGIWEILRSSFRDILLRSDLRWIAFTFAILFVELRISFHYYTPGLLAAGVNSPVRIGLVHALLNVVAATATRLTPRFLGGVKEETVLVRLAAFLGLTFLVLGFVENPAGVLLCFFFQQIPFGVHFPIVNSYVNHRVGSDRRATVLSCLSLLGRASFALVFPVVGQVVDLAGFPTTMLLVGGLGWAGAAASLLLHRHGMRRSDGTGSPSP